MEGGALVSAGSDAKGTVGPVAGGEAVGVCVRPDGPAVATIHASATKAKAPTITAPPSRTAGTDGGTLVVSGHPDGRAEVVLEVWLEAGAWRPTAPYGPGPGRSLDEGWEGGPAN
jgi:hypothetical protein